MRLLIFILLFPFLTEAQTVQVNGTGLTVTINAAGKPSSINIAAPPPSAYYPAETGDITFTDAHFQYSYPGRSGTGFTERSVGGYVEFRTTATSIDVKIGGNYSTATGTIDKQSECPVLVDGVYNQSVQLTADNTTQTHTITLPGGSKIVRLINGYATLSASSILYPTNGVYIQGVVSATAIEIKRPVVPDTLRMFIGNSITAGYDADHPGATDVVSLFREQDGWNTINYSWGGRRIMTSNSTEADQMAAVIDDMMNGSTLNEVLVLLGTNNWQSFGGQTKATFKTYYGNFLDALHTLRPDIIIYCVSPLNRSNYNDANSQGAFIEDFVDAIEELLVDRTWAKFIYGKDLVSLANMPLDGLHPNQTGMQEIHDNLLIQYNLLNP